MEKRDALVRLFFYGRGKKCGESPDGVNARPAAQPPGVYPHVDKGTNGGFIHKTGLFVHNRGMSGRIPRAG